MGELLTVSEFGNPGFVADKASFTNTPQAWDEVKNFRFNSLGAQSFLGEAAVMSSAGFEPLWLKAFPPVEAPIWLYGGLERVFALRGGHNDITRVSGLYTGDIRERWQGEVLNGVGLLNNVLDVPQVWPDFDPSERLIDLPGWPVGFRCKALRTFKNFAIAIYMIENGNERPYRVRWSDAAPPGVIPSGWALNDPASFAGEKDISETSDYLVDGLQLGELFILYKQKSTYAMQFVDKPDVFAHWRILGDGRGLLWRDCVQEFPGGHFVAGIDDLYIHTGARDSSVSIVEAKLRNWIFNQIDSSNFFNCFTVNYTRKSEIWFCFPEAGAIYATIAIIWNRITGGIGVRDLRNTPFIYPGPIEVDPEGRIWGGVDSPVLTGNLVGTTGELEWTVPASTDPIVSYTLFRSVNGAGFLPLITQPGVTYDDLLLESGNDYDYEVVANTAAETSLPSNVVRLTPNAVDGAMLVWPTAVLFSRTQAGIDILRTPDGYGAVAGIVTIAGGANALVSKALGSIGDTLDLSVRVTGTDSVGSVINEDISVNDAAIYTVGTLTFFTITGVTLLSSEEGADGFYCVGYRKRTAVSTSGFDLITMRGAITIRSTAPTAGNMLKEGLLGSFGTAGLCNLPAASQLSFMRQANPAARTFTVDGVEAIAVPSGSVGQEVLSLNANFASVTTIACAGASTNPFFDVGIIHRGPAV